MAWIKLQIPEVVDEGSLLALLTEDIPRMGDSRVDDYDFRGKYVLKKANNLFEDTGIYDRELFTKVLINKIIGAIGYERLKGKERAAAFSYNRATKAAFILGFNMVAFRCAFRTVRIYNEIIQSDNGEYPDFKNLNRAIEHVNEAVDKVMERKIKVLYGNDIDWFQ